jgi:hypothetical protein
VRWFFGASVAAVLIAGMATHAQASVVINIDKSTQRMTVSVDGETRHSWPVSTGRAGFGTPNGHFRPQRLARRWFSRKYYNSPMPHSIFFHHGFAIHGSYEIRRLGGPASHGCVRLHPGNAATLFALVNSEGAANTRIVVSGASPVQVARGGGRRSLAARTRGAAPRTYAEPWDPWYRPPTYPRWYQGDF